MGENLVLSEPLFWSLATACTGGFIMLSYEAFAIKNGWAIGKLFRSNFAVIIGGLSIIGSVGFAIANLSLVYGLVVLVLGFILGLILSMIWKTYVQWVALILLVGSWIFQFYI